MAETGGEDLPLKTLDIYGDVLEKGLSGSRAYGENGNTLDTEKT